MNISTLNEYIQFFENDVIKSGFQRDIQDFLSSLNENQNNIVALRGIAENTSNWLRGIYESDLPEALGNLFVDQVNPFTDHPHDTKLMNLIEDPEIDQAVFFQNLNQILSNLNQQIKQNAKEVGRIKNFIQPYLDMRIAYQKEEFKAIVSIIFKDINTISILKELTKTLQIWNRILPLYHRLMKSTSPEEIEIVTIQNGSIDILINIYFDIALNLADLFKVGFQSFMAYLSYKKLAKPIIESYFGNEKLIEGEKDREKELINNIGGAVRKNLIEQHQKAKKRDEKIDSDSDKKIEQVVKLVSSHILKGNDIKLLALPESDDEEKQYYTENKKELRTISSQVSQAMKIIPPKEMKALLEKYGDPE